MLDFHSDAQALEIDNDLIWFEENLRLCRQYETLLSPQGPLGVHFRKYMIMPSQSVVTLPDRTLEMVALIPFVF